jgi:predicted NUDIX family NTP pyrophosphohydrolase
MTKRSAGLLVYRFTEPIDAGSTPRAEALEVLIAHMGGPFWARKDDAAWSIPKGEYEPDEEPLAAALREFEEEMGSPPPSAEEYLTLGEFRQSSGKIVTIFATPGEFDVSTFASNTFEMEWPRGSGRIQAYPEMDRAAWFSLEQAATKLVKGQLPVLAALQSQLKM